MHPTENTFLLLVFTRFSAVNARACFNLKAFGIKPTLPFLFYTNQETPLIMKLLPVLLHPVQAIRSVQSDQGVSMIPRGWTGRVERHAYNGNVASVEKRLVEGGCYTTFRSRVAVGTKSSKTSVSNASNRFGFVKLTIQSRLPRPCLCGNRMYGQPFL